LPAFTGRDDFLLLDVGFVVVQHSN
jgi:hypothetical protein